MHMQGKVQSKCPRQSQRKPIRIFRNIIDWFARYSINSLRCMNDSISPVVRHCPIPLLPEEQSRLPNREIDLSASTFPLRPSIYSVLTSVISSMMVRPAAVRLASGLNGALSVPSMKLWCDVATRARSPEDGVTL